MFEAFSRSLAITKLSLDVIKKDKELLLFPVLSGIFSFLFIISLLFPTVIVGLLSSSGKPAITGLGILLLFIVYFGLAFIATFFNVCIVYTTKKRFEGGNASFSESIKFAFSRIHLIFAWSLLSATVGLILRFIENLAEKSKGVGRFVLNITHYLLGAVWSIITLFVVPAMVYKNIGPFDAIKNSVESLKKTWGESLIRYYGVGLVQFFFIILGVVFGIGLFLTSSLFGVVGMVFAILFIIAYFVLVIVFFSLINSIFNTALYAYANKGKLPKEYRKDIMQNAFVSRKK